MFKITFITAMFDSSYILKKVCRKLKEEYNGEFGFEFLSTYDIDSREEVFKEATTKIDNSDLVCVFVHGGISYFKSYKKLMDMYKGKKKFFMYSSIEDENRELFRNSNIPNLILEKMLNYYLMGGENNFENLIKYCANKFNDKNYQVILPQKPIWEGIYYKGIVENTQSYVDKAIRSSKPIVGILFYSGYVNKNNTRHIDAFIEEVEKQGAFPLAVFTNSVEDKILGAKGIKWAIKNILKKGNEVVPDVIINTMAHSQSVLGNPGDGTKFVEKSIFEELNIPIIQAMTTYQTRKQWDQDLRGVDMMSLIGNVYDPEFDGQIISVTAACIQFIKDEIGERMIFVPIEERVNKVCRLALNWAKLKNLSTEQKKVAIIFHNMPPRNDMIGAAFGLDTPKSVYNMVNSLKEEGIKTKYDFQDGRDIIDRIINSVTNDKRWLSTSKILEKSVDLISAAQYIECFNLLPQEVKEKMNSDWGEAPGEFMVYEKKMPIPGIVNGNIFIGLQPSRGYIEKAEEAYHSTDLVPPHQYIAYYKWIRNIFKADVVVHVGTHGTLEWLPGKEIGLSEKCYPDIAIDDLPHLYPYSINVTGEGIQVKRRSNGVILSHLIPSLTLSESYDDVEELDNIIKQYYQSLVGDAGKLQILKEQIIETSIKNNYHVDLKICEEDMKNNFQSFLDKLHGYIEEIKSSLIKDGLHIFGQCPEEERLNNLIFALMRIDNKTMISLPKAIGELLGCNINQLKDGSLTGYSSPTNTKSVSEDGDGSSIYAKFVSDSGDDSSQSDSKHRDGSPKIAMNKQGLTNLMILEEIEKISLDIINEYSKHSFDIKSIEKVIEHIINTKIDRNIFSNALSTDEVINNHESVLNVKKALAYISKIVCPKLYKTEEELKYFLEGVRGNFVPPGKSGCPTRGNINVLPSGRNFYSVDPNCIPTKASWEVGKSMGQDLLNRYLEDEGQYPENIVMVVYSGETMKTNGDDIAEAMYLMGVKPVWLEGTDRVIGLEAIPYDELKRPRVDVTLRITGLFRDTFPNLIELMEECVNLVSQLNEDEDINYLKKNIGNEVNKLLSEGISLEEAVEEANMRIFGCPPGTYGAGVDILINSRNWTERDELGQAYIQWSGFAYGKDFHGKKVTEVFTRRLSSAEVTVKNECSNEIDMLESDDFYNYHGGLIAAVNAAKGEMPKSYCGNSSDPSRTKIKDVNEETARIMRARILNPKWFEGLKKHGYKGAQEISAMVDIVFGWDATSNVLEDWMYDRICEAYIFNKERREWIKKENSWAMHNMVERMLEANQRGMWKTDENNINELKKIYMNVEGDIEELEDI